MKKNLLVAAIAVCVITLASCKKNSDDIAPSLAGNWNANSIVNWETEHSSGIVTKDTTIFQAGSYLNFAGDGKLYSKYIVAGIPQFDTSYYTVNGSNIYTQDFAGGPNVDTAQVLTLTANNAVIHIVSDDSMFFDQTWINLSR